VDLQVQPGNLPAMREPPTPQGTATRARIVAATADLVWRHGAGATTLDDVRAATATSKSQLYHYFGDKAGLLLAVVAHQRDAVLEQQRLVAEPLDSFEALHRWRYRTLAAHRRSGLDRPCPLGRLAAELVDDERARPVLRAALALWHEQLAAGLRAMHADGLLHGDADPEALAGALLGAVQGGRLLAATQSDIEPLRHCLDTALGRLVELGTPRTA